MKPLLMTPGVLRGPYPLAVSMILLLGVWVWSSTPFTAPMSHAVNPGKTAYEDYFLDVTLGQPLSGPWSLREVRSSDSALTAHLTDGADVYDVYFTSPELNRRGRGLRMTWFRRYVPHIPEHDQADFHRAVHVLSVALERGSKSFRPWLYDSFPSNLPPRAYQVAFLTLLGALAWAARRRLRLDRPHVGAALGFVALLCGGLGVRLLLSPFAPLHANLHGLEELDHLVFPLDSPYPGYYGRAQEALVDLLLVWLPRSGQTFFATQACIGVLTAAGAGLVARCLTGNSAAGWAAAAFGLASPHLIRVSTSESAFQLVACLLFPTLWGLIRYARDGDRVGLLAGGAGAVLITQFHAITPVFLALPAAAWIMAPRGKRLQRFVGFGLLTVAILILLIPHLSFLLALHEERGGTLVSGVLPRLPVIALSRGNLVANPATGPVLLSVSALIGVVLLWWRHRAAAGLVTAITPLFIVCFVLQTCWTDMVRYQALIAAWVTVPAGIGISLAFSMVSRLRWRLLLAVGLLAVGAVSWPGPWSAHLRPDVEAMEYTFLDESIASLPQHGVMVKMATVREPPGISSYFPMAVFRQNKSSYRIIEADALRELVDEGKLPGDEPIYFYRGLGYAWLEFHALEGTDEVKPAERDRAREALEANQEALEGFRQEVVATRRIRRQLSPVAGYRMDFNELPGPVVDLELVRLVPE